MQTFTVPRFEPTSHQDDLERQALGAIVAMMLDYGLSDARIKGMAYLPREWSDMRELARVMARNMIAQERVQRVCTPDPTGLLNTHRTIR